MGEAIDPTNRTRRGLLQSPLTPLPDLAKASEWDERWAGTEIGQQVLDEDRIESDRLYAIESVRAKDKYARMPIEGPKVWRRQKGETSKAFSAFMAYLTLPGDQRTLASAAKMVGRSRSLMQNWSRQWSWVLRAAAYEEHYLLIQLDSVAADRDRMWKEQQEIAGTAVDIVTAAMETIMTEHTKDGKIDLSVIRPEVIVRLFTESTKLQRIAVLGRADAAEKIAEQHEALAERWSDELALMFTTFMNNLNLDDEQQAIAEKVLREMLELPEEPENKTTRTFPDGVIR